MLFWETVERSYNLDYGTHILFNFILKFFFDIFYYDSEIGRIIPLIFGFLSIPVISYLTYYITKDKSKSDFFDNDEDTIVDKIKNVSNNSNALVNKDNADMEDKYADEENQSHYKASSVLDLKLTKTPGYCYVGTEQNYRTCVKVGAGDTCMSGQVFPTENLCINPNLKE